MSPSLRERKKEQTRRAIADAAAGLFGERGFENVAVVDIANAAEVSEQTVYNYFPTKEHLVLDQDEELRDRLTDLVRNRQPGETPAAAIRNAALDFVRQLETMSVDEAKGGLGHLAAVSPAVRRMSLAMTDRHAQAIAEAVAATSSVGHPAVAKLHGVAVAWVFQTITDEVGQRLRRGHAPKRIARELRPIVSALVDEVDRWQADQAAR